MLNVSVNIYRGILAFLVVISSLFGIGVVTNSIRFTFYIYIYRKSSREWCRVLSHNAKQPLH